MDKKYKVVNTDKETQNIHNAKSEHYKSESPALTNETEYIDLFNSVGDAIYIQDENGTFLEVNTTALNMYGYEKKEIIGKTPEMLSAPGKNDTEKIINYLKDAFNGIQQKFEFWGIRKNGEVFPKEVVLNKGFYNGKRVIIATAREISDRKKNEDKILLNEIRLEAMLQLNKMSNSSKKDITNYTLQEAVKITSSQYGYLAFVNKEETILEMFSWSEGAYKDCKIENKQFLYEINKTGLWGDTIRQRKPIITNDYLKEKNPERSYPEGHVNILRHLGVPVFDGNKIVALIGVGNKIEPYDETDIKQLTLLMNALRDLLMRKKTEEELRNIHLRLITLFKNISDVVLYETGGKEEFITENIEKILGYSVENFIMNNKFFSTLIHPDYKNDIEKITNEWYASDNNSGENLKLEYPCKCRDGKFIWIENYMIKAKGLENDYLLGIIQNIDERKKNEERLTKVSEALRELNFNKDKFFSIIAHDLRGPFNSLLGFSTVLQEDLDWLNKEEITEYASFIHSSSKKLYNLVENLLQWARIQTGRMEYQPIKIDLYEAVFKIFELFNSMAITKKINIWNDVKNNIFVYADQNMLYSILQNLISNSLKFTNTGGSVTIKAKELIESIEISVADTGIGIKEKDLEKLFRIDVQFSKAGTAEEEGTGLGLILCKELIEKNRGKIRVESIYGKGTAFIFTIPKWGHKYFKQI